MPRSLRQTLRRWGRKKVSVPAGADVSDILLSNNTIPAPGFAFTTVGILTAVGGHGAITFAKVSVTGYENTNAIVTLVGADWCSRVRDTEEVGATTFTLRVRADDSGGPSFEKDFEIVTT